MKTFSKVLALSALALVGTAGIAAAGDCHGVQVQQTVLAQPVVVQAAPVFVVPSAPTVQFNVTPVFAAHPVVVQAAPVVVQKQVVQRNVVVQRQVVQKQVVPQRQVVRQFSFQRTRVR